MSDFIVSNSSKAMKLSSNESLNFVIDVSEELQLSLNNPEALGALQSNAGLAAN